MIWERKRTAAGDEFVKIETRIIMTNGVVPRKRVHTLSDPSSSRERQTRSTIQGHHQERRNMTQKDKFGAAER